MASETLPIAAHVPVLFVQRCRRVHVLLVKFNWTTSKLAFFQYLSAVDLPLCFKLAANIFSNSGTVTHSTVHRHEEFFLWLLGFAYERDWTWWFWQSSRDDIDTFAWNPTLPIAHYCIPLLSRQRHTLSWGLHFEGTLSDCWCVGTQVVEIFSNKWNIGTFL